VFSVFIPYLRLARTGGQSAVFCAGSSRLAPSPTPGDTAWAMSEESVEVVRRWWAGFNEDGMPPLALCDEEIEIRNPPDFPVRGPFYGHDGVRDWREQVFEVLDNARVEPEEIVDVHGDGETVLMLLRATGTATHTDIEMDVEWAAIWTVRGGKLLKAQGYLNRADALEAAGLRE
jgi:ketosteroid isomerase-like protein